MSQPTAAELDAYRARTDRLLKLTDFAGRYVSAYGSTSGSGFERGELIDADTPPAIKKARDAALLAAFAAIEAIARQS